MPRTDRASRIIAAAPEQVFRAFVTKDELLRWLPPAGSTGRFEHFDLRPGGSYRLVLEFAAAPGKTTENSDVFEVRIVEVVEGVRLVQAADFVSDDPAFAGTMLMTWQVAAVAEGTRVEIIAEQVPDGISAEDHAEGLGSSLDQLARFVTR